MCYHQLGEARCPFLAATTKEERSAVWVLVEATDEEVKLALGTQHSSQTACESARAERKEFQRHAAAQRKVEADATEKLRLLGKEVSTTTGLSDELPSSR